MKSRSGLGAYFESRALRVESSKHEVFQNARVPKLLRIGNGIRGSRSESKTDNYQNNNVRNESFLPGFFSKKPRNPLRPPNKFNIAELLSQQHIEVFEVGAKFL